MLEQTLSIISCSVMGLNYHDRISIFLEMIVTSSHKLVHIQEPKLGTTDAATIIYFGDVRLRNFLVTPALGTRGGILLF